ncbi:MAG: hypothetical protein ACREHF_10980 [Rhizomicrobium sp.]
MAIASVPAPQAQGFGLGMHSCAEFAEQYRANPVVVEDAYVAWAEGYMSGLNIESAVLNLPERSLAGLDLESIKVEIRSYCDNHPLAAYLDAVTAAYLARPPLPKNSN